MKNVSKLFLAVAALSTLFLAGPASAESTFAKKHPRRAEVLHRDRNEINRNKGAYANGKITKGQENKLNREDRSIRRQEQRDARNNGGHITKGEQRRLNREENSVNRQRNRDEVKDGTR